MQSTSRGAWGVRHRAVECVRTGPKQRRSCRTGSLVVGIAAVVLATRKLRIGGGVGAAVHHRTLARRALPGHRADPRAARSTAGQVGRNRRRAAAVGVDSDQKVVPKKTGQSRPRHET